MPGSVRLRLTTASKPRSRIASSARRRRRCSRVSRPAWPLVDGQRRRQVLRVAVDPADLLDQVDLASHVVVAVERHRRLEVLASRETSKSSRSRYSPQSSGSISMPRSSRRPARAAASSSRAARHVGRLVDRPGHQLRPAELDHQPRSDPLGAQGQLGVQLLLEAVGGVGAQAELARGAQDVDPVPGRDLEQHPGGRLRDLGDLAAHDPGDARGAVAVADQHRVLVEGPLDAVERRHLLPRLRGADDQRTVRDLVEVEGVQRLRRHQHHVVGDVDDVVDRPHARHRSAAP